MAMAEGGTLLLDELSEMPIDTQSKLLRVLQEKEVRPVGGRTSFKTDCRIIASTNRQVEDALREGKVNVALPSFAPPADPRLPRSVLLAVSLRRAHRTRQCASVPASLAFYAFFVVFIVLREIVHAAHFPDKRLHIFQGNNLFGRREVGVENFGHAAFDVGNYFLVTGVTGEVYFNAVKVIVNLFKA